MVLSLNRICLKQQNGTEKQPIRMTNLVNIIWQVYIANGIGVEKNLPKAIELYRLSADQNYSLSQFEMGFGILQWNCSRKKYRKG